MVTDCIFCKYANGGPGADIVFQDEDVFAFKDKFAKYPVHVLIIPKKHIESIANVSFGDDVLIGKLLRIGAQIAKEKGLSEDGFRLLVNKGEHAGQTVQHLHIHLIGGEKLRPI